MPSRLHEALLELFRSRPTLAADLLTGSFQLDLPDWQHARVESGELTELTPTEYRADTVVVFTAQNTPVMAIVIEVQLRRDRRKRYTWPHYLTSLHARLRCPVMLLVVCPKPAVANWCTNPIDVGHPGWLLRPLVLGPGQVPVVTDQQARQAPELAVLSALAHGAGQHQQQVFRALLSGLQRLDVDHAEQYADLLLTLLPEAARHSLETLVTTKAPYEFQSDFFRRQRAQGLAEGRAEGRAEGHAEGHAEGLAEGHAEGLAEGEATAVLAVLAARGIEVPDHLRQRITDCVDLDQLEAWLRRAATAGTIDDVFLPQPQ